MKLSEFKYSITKNAIAKFPAEPRDSSKLMILNKDTGEIQEKVFKEIVDYFNRGFDEL